MKTSTRLLALVAFASLAETRNASAADYYFNPAVGSYGAASNWRIWNGSAYVTAATAPTSVDDVYFSWLTATQTVSFNANAAASNVYVINGTSAFDLGLRFWNVAGAFNVGNGYTGTATVSRGTVNATAFTVGAGAGVTGTFNLGTATFNTTNAFYSDIGYNAAGTVNINSGGSYAGGPIRMGYFAGSTATLNINSGGVVATQWIEEGSGNGTIKFNGGTLRALGNNLPFLLGFESGDVQILSGGATIDTNGFDIGISTALQGGGGQTALTKQGAGTLTLTGASSYTGNTDLKAGSLVISSGGSITNTSGSVGDSVGDTATATVTGTGSKWVNSNTMYVGNNGTGTLNVQGGGLVSGTGSMLGRFSGSNGTATVTGSGSQWNSSDATVVGNSGAGTLNIQSGGKVTNTNIGFIGYNAGVTGAVTVTGTGSQWVNGTTTRVGLYGTGTLTIQSGGTVSDTGGYIGYYSGSGGTATVDGTGSSWTHSLNLYVGEDGNGSLTVQNGGNVSNTVGYIGDQAGTGTATVTGSGSQWSSSGVLYIGNAGTGTLTVSAAGKVTASSVTMANSGSSKGTLNLNGSSGSRGVLETSSVTEGSGTGGGTMNFNGGVLKATAASADFLAAFESGDVQIQSGGAFFDTNGFNVTVNSTVQFGGTGGITKQNTGTLTLSGNRTYTGSNRVEGGTLSNAAGTLDSSNMAVTGTGSQWNNTSDLYVGNSGNGTLTIQNGGAVSNVNGFISVAGGGTGSVTVTGSGSQWTNSGGLSIGYGGNGALNILNGGKVSNTYGYIAAGSAVTVSDTGSLWQLTNDFHIGNGSVGTLTIKNGGKVTSSVSVIGSSAGGIGTVTVTDNGSLWQPFDIRMGNTGVGTLNIQAGGRVSAYSITLAYTGTGGQGTLNLNGTSGSRGALETNFLQKGTGTGGATINFNGGILRATATQASLLQGFATGDVQLQSTGAFVDSNGFNVGIDNVLQGAGGLTKQGAGTLTLSAANAFTGTTTVEAGTLAISGRIASAVTVQSGGTLLLAGTGDTDRIANAANLTLAGGTLSMAGLSNSTEQLGALILSADSAIDFGSSTGNRLLFSGLTLGSFTLSIYNWSGSLYSIGQSDPGTDLTQDRLIFTGNVSASPLSQIRFFSGANGSAQVGVGGQISFGTPTGSFEVVPVPEPATIFGGLALLGLIGYRERRRFSPATR